MTIPAPLKPPNKKATPATPRKPAAPTCAITKDDFNNFMQHISDGVVDLVLTDPPYTISRKTGFHKLGPNSIKRFAVSMDFGAWDHARIDLQQLARQAYRVLRSGGSAIVFYDIWKITPLFDAMRAAGFKQMRLIHWEKTNPVPLNSKRNYLTNSREIAVLGVKHGKPTFHSEYDNGVYRHPIPRQRGGRLHPTQKPLALFRQLIEKHSNRGDLVVDPFLGAGTTAAAARALGRRFAGCDANEKYVEAARRRLHQAADINNAAPFTSPETSARVFQGTR